MIDFDKPMRIARSKRQVFVTGVKVGARILDTTNTGRPTGFAYGVNGQPMRDECPWGPIENFDPTEELFLTTEEVMSPAIKRAQRRMADENDSNPLWGMF